MLGTTLSGRYKIIRNLAAGGFGATYVAEDRQLPGAPLCVVKQLKPKSSDPFTLQTARRLFDTEAQVLYELGSHDQIPRLLAHFEENKQFYLVQELIEGQDLSRELTPGKRVSEGFAIALLVEILKILEFIHQRHVIHRDIKPSNLIRRASDGKLVLIDFGAVKQIRSAGVEPVGQLSATVAVGTPGYMASEQANGYPQPCSDIYAVGALAIQALTGLFPTQLPKHPKTLEINWRDRANVSPELARIIDKMARYNCSDRYQSATQVLQAIAPLARANDPKAPRSLFGRVTKVLGELLSGSAPAPALPAPSEGAIASPAEPAVTTAPPDALTQTLATTRSARIFISYHSQEPDRTLAGEFYQTLKAVGHRPFMAGESIRLGEQWPLRVSEELKHSDYFLLLLSPLSAGSEMVSEEVRRAKMLRDASPEGKPVILPIRVNLPFEVPLNYELRGYLNQIQQREWRDPADTPMIVREILSVVATGEAPTQMDVSEEMPSVPPGGQNSDALPLPAAEPELPEGQVELASSFYVLRSPIEARAYQEIKRPGALIRIKAPRQMGKTSLMARILHQATQQGYQTVPLSFQLADAKVLADLDGFLRWFCASIGRRLRVPNRLAELWDVDMFGSKDNCTAYFEEYLLQEIKTPIALGLDEVDRIFEHPVIADDFFGLLRAWHEEAKNRDIWKKLRLVVVHSTEVYIPMNVNQSPFNVGLPIELPEFTSEQVLDLAKRHGLDWRAGEVSQLMAMVGGHPYLVRLALYHIARRDMTLEQVLQQAPTEAGLYRDHLRRFLWLIQQQPNLVEAFKQVAAATGNVRLEPQQAFRLHSMGLVHLEGNEVRLRCDLYRQYFGVTAKKQVQELCM